MRSKCEQYRGMLRISSCKNRATDNYNWLIRHTDTPLRENRWRFFFCSFDHIARDVNSIISGKINGIQSRSKHHGHMMVLDQLWSMTGLSLHEALLVAQNQNGLRDHSQYFDFWNIIRPFRLLYILIYNRYKIIVVESRWWMPHDFV